jgi:hypothetical protein
MVDQVHLDILKQGVKQWNKWRKQHPEIRPDLSNADMGDAVLSDVDMGNADLSNATLNGTNFGNANFSNADLSNAGLDGTNLSDADLSDADLSGVNLSNADLSTADLSGANLSGAKLYFANLSGTRLRRAKLYKCRLTNTIFAQVDLREVKGLTELYHEGPSHITLQTIQLPQDGSALHFLRSAGIPEEWIAFYQTTMMYPIQYYSCFISYSSKDDTLAHRLHADLQDQGVRCWFAPEDMKIGDKIRVRIDEAIHRQEKLLLILSATSVTSDWVEHEVEMALAKERKEQRTVLFPIRVDRAILDQEDQGWPALVRHQRHIGDFTNWTDPQAYQTSFKRLLTDLKKTS